MNEPVGFTEPLLCKRCHAEIRETDNYCHACGKSLKPGHGFLFTHTGIILMALVLGPFVLPFVWMSKAISPLAKVIYSLLFLISGFYMMYCLWQLFAFTQQSMQSLMGDLNNLQGGLNSLQGLNQF